MVFNTTHVHYHKIFFFSDIDFTKEHSRSQGMPPTIDALNVRVSLAQQYNENAQYNLNCIEILINDQHIMHQGLIKLYFNFYSILFFSVSRIVIQFTKSFCIIFMWN